MVAVPRSGPPHLLSSLPQPLVPSLFSAFSVLRTIALCCPSGSDGRALSPSQCPRLAWWPGWKMFRCTMGKMLSSPWIFPPSSRAPGSLTGKNSRVTSRRARWSPGPCATASSRKAYSTGSSCEPSSTSTAGPWWASAARAFRTQPPSPSKVGAGGDQGRQIGHKAHVNLHAM